MGFNLWICLGIFFLFLLSHLGLWQWLRWQIRLWETQLKHLELNLQELGHQVVDKELSQLRRCLEETRAELHQITNIIAGRQSGAAMERALEKALSLLPQGWILRNVDLGPGRVEFALKLPGGYLVPVDSKFIDLGEEKITPGEIKHRLKMRIEEVRKYLTDPRTIGFAVVVVPEGVYPLCRSILASLAEQCLIVVSQKELLPVLSATYLLAQYLGISQDLEETKKELLQAQEASKRALASLAKQQNALVQLGNRRDEVWRELGLIERILSRLTGKGTF